MAKYLLGIQQPDGWEPPAEFLEPIMREMRAINAEMESAGAWVFAAGLAPPASSTVLRPQDDEVLMTDGPYVEGKEFLGGFTIVEAPDLDAALEWGRRYAKASGLPIEVRPVNHVGG